jgi:hypothetical protein
MSEQNIRSIVIDFTTDLSKVFPEYAFMWERWLTADDAEYEKLNQHFIAVFPDKFFDIMNSNSEIFNANSESNTMFLPDVDFKLLFNCQGVSENTKTAMWKYLQLILFTVVGSIKDASHFGDAMNLLESMDETDLQSKMQETINGLGDFFKGFSNESDSDSQRNNESNNESSNSRESETCESDESSSSSSSAPFKLPKPEVLREHMKTLMDGKLGKLAKELTEEFTEDLKDVFSENDSSKSIKDLMAQIMKDPKKLMTIMKKITDKLQTKMKNGDISQDELMKEVSGLVEKFKEMGGGDDIMKTFTSGPFAKMFKGMAGQASGQQMPGGSKHSAMKERLRRKMEEKKLREAQAQVQAKSFVVKIGDEKQEKSAPLSEAELIKLFNKKSKK